MRQETVCCTPQSIVRRARSQIGVSFRLHGRRPGTALDCIGLACFALFGEAALASLPFSYRLKGEHESWLLEELAQRGLGKRPMADAPRPGDLLICRPGPAQAHLAIATGSGLVHAHAGLGRVAEAPLDGLILINGIWRLNTPVLKEAEPWRH